MRPRPPQLHPRGLVCAVVLLLFGASVHAQPPSDRRMAAVAAACPICHRDKFEAAAGNPHAQLDSERWQQETGVPLGCLNCHGDVTRHLQSGGGRGNVFAFREEPAMEQNATCLGCHRESHPDFHRSPHARAGLACTSCHAQHASGFSPAPHALLREPDRALLDLGTLGAGSRICSDCHADSLTDFAFNERHRLTEGVLECTSCHDPHAAADRPLLGGFKQQQCLECHSDKGGPFVFEHAASRTEGCTACHSPHGSPNRHMLAHQRVGELCFTCHAAVPQFHAGFAPAGPPRFGLDTQCTNCHSAIHGSNFDPYFLK